MRATDADSSPCNRAQGIVNKAAQMSLVGGLRRCMKELPNANCSPVNATGRTFSAVAEVRGQ